MFRSIALLTLLLSPVGIRGETPPPPKVAPKVIDIPKGYAAVASFEAKGVQIYRAIERQPCALVWVLQAPKADLYDAKGKKVGTHSAGPTWESADGSELVRDTDVAVVSIPASDPKSDIPSLLIRVKSKGKAGLLSDVVYVHRLKTRGGVAPKKAPDDLSSKVSVPYTATYVFYAKKD